MNELELQLKETIQRAIQSAFSISLEIDEIIIEMPKDKSFGDYSTNAAMRLAKTLKQKPRDIAQAILDAMEFSSSGIDRMEIAGAGFLNIFMEKASLANIIETILDKQDDYGRNNAGNHQKVNVEFVSANPTGDLHLGHARGAAMGDAICRMLAFSGYDVTREYYVNDAGNQIHNLALSLYARYKQLFNQEASLPEDGYYGKDVIEIAKQIKEAEGDKYLSMNEEEAIACMRSLGMKAELKKLEEDLALFRVHFDVWSSEQSLYDEHKVEASLSKLVELGATYESEGALWLKTTLFGDDKDRVLRKSDGSYTYLTPDIAYHKDKFDRGFDLLVNLWGADHHGYIPRMKAAMQSLGYDPERLEVDIIQMVRLIKDGEEMKMSKRTGNAVTLKELIEEANVDSVRYFFVNRAPDTHFDFDLDLATKQSNDNPVYYVQYAHARICSILRQMDGFAVASQYDLLVHEKEMDLLKHMNEFPSVVAEAAKTRLPHKICNYAMKLASLFHSFYAECKVLDADQVELSGQRLALLLAAKITLKNALELVGVEAKDKM